MGFLDHSTNNIIIDAVLTDRGRELLATQGASFAITRFALSDDEVDYTLVQKFGRTVGREKIIKNTPIFEAQTRGDLALKNKLKTLSSATKRYMPNLTLQGTNLNAAAGTIAVQHTLGSQANPAADLSLSVAKTGNEALAVELIDTAFDVIANTELINVQAVGGGAFQSFLDMVTHQTTHTVPSSQTSISATGGEIAKIQISAKDSITADTFDLYSDPANPNQIQTVVSMVGQESGLRQDVTVIIEKQV